MPPPFVLEELLGMKVIPWKGYGGRDGTHRASTATAPISVG